MKRPIKTTIRTGALIAAFGFAVPAAAQTELPEGFSTGPVFADYGPVAEIADADMVIPNGAQFRVAFDAAKGADLGQVNRNLTSLARFINMHVAAGVAPDDMRLALVVHGSAVFDITENLVYGDKHTPGVDDKMPNPNAALIAQLLGNNVRIIICGQSAAAQGLEKGDFLPGVEMALSAMTAHALLQQGEYTLNPF